MKKKLVNSIIGALTAFAMAGLIPITALADAPATGEGVSSQTIPVTATVDDYYIVSMPANLDGSGNLNLTREYTKAYKGDAGYIETTGSDTHHTFYGYTTVGVMGSISDGKKVHASLTCNPLVKTGDTGTTADVGMTNLSTEQTGKAAIIWGSDENAKSGKDLAFASADWTTGATGISMDFLNTEVNPATEVSKSAMLRTTLPVDGTYNSNLEISFSLSATRTETGTFALYHPGSISKVEVLDSAGHVVHETGSAIGPSGTTEPLGVVPGDKIRLTHDASFKWYYGDLDGQGHELGTGSIITFTVPAGASGLATLDNNSDDTSTIVYYDNSHATGWVRDAACYPSLVE